MCGYFGELKIILPLQRFERFFSCPAAVVTTLPRHLITRAWANNLRFGNESCYLKMHPLICCTLILSGCRSCKDAVKNGDYAASNGWSTVHRELYD